MHAQAVRQDTSRRFRALQLCIGRSMRRLFPSRVLLRQRLVLLAFALHRLCRRLPWPISIQKDPRSLKSRRAQDVARMSQVHVAELREYLQACKMVAGQHTLPTGASGILAAASKSSVHSCIRSLRCSAIYQCWRGATIAYSAHWHSWEGYTYSRSGTFKTIEHERH